MEIFPIILHNKIGKKKKKYSKGQKDKYVTFATRF